jgi:hypothetical protein
VAPHYDELWAVGLNITSKPMWTPPKLHPPPSPGRLSQPRLVASRQGTDAARTFSKSAAASATSAASAASAAA